MPKRKPNYKKRLPEKYPPSEPCTCDICLHYCTRPGWWTVEQAEQALKAGYGNRMMLEIAPELTFGVLSPAFRGCERSIATNEFAARGCTFLKNDRCELFGTGYQPLECRFCHHDRRGLGSRCHRDLVQLVEKSLTANVVFGIYYGISNNKGAFWDITNARMELGFEPVDDGSTC